jgi:hypothetical protein
MLEGLLGLLTGQDHICAEWGRRQAQRAEAERMTENPNNFER